VSTVANPPAGTTQFNITFTGALANRDVAPITVSANSETQQLAFDDTLTGGTFGLVNPLTGQIVSVPFDTSAANLLNNIQGGLNSLFGNEVQRLTLNANHVFTATLTGAQETPP